MRRLAGRVGVVVVASVVLALGGRGVQAAAQAGSLAGVVSDRTGAAIAGASVELTDGQGVVRSATAGADGRYRFDGLSAGGYTIRIASPGFELFESTVEVTPGAETRDEVVLDVGALTEAVTVVEARARAVLEAERAVTPGGVTIVESDDLYRRHVSGLADLLRYVPGVWAESSSGSEELFVSSRGSNLDATDYDKNGVKLLQDGLPVTTADGNNHNRVVDPLSARYTVAARGANALTYGASTLGGAIDFISPTARNSAPAAVALTTGSHGSLNGRVSLGRAGEAFDGLLTVEGRRWDGYRAHTSQERWGLYANAGWQASDTVSLRLFGTYVDNDQRLPGALTRREAEADPRQASAAAIGGDYGKTVRTARVAARATWAPGDDASLTAGVSYEAQALFHPIVDKIFVDFDGPGPQAPVEVFSLLVDTDHRDLGAMVRYEWRAGRHDLLVGLNLGDGSVTGGNNPNDGGRPDGISEFVDNGADSLEAFVMDRWRVADRWTVVAGAQVVSAGRDVRTRNAATGALSHPRRRYSAVNPRVGVIAALGATAEVYGNVSRLFEAPTTFEMQDDVRGGDATLDPMSGVVVETGVRSAAGDLGEAGLFWDVTAYYARIRDEILSVDDPAAPGNSLTTNVDRTIHAGIEAAGGARVPLAVRHRLESRLSLTVNAFRFDDDAAYDDNRLPAAPRYAARGEVLYRHATGVYVGPTFDLVGRRYADFANTYTIDAYGLVGLRAGLTRDRWELFGEVRNLFDRDYIATIGVLDVAGAEARVLHPGAPVSAYLGVRASY